MIQKIMAASPSSARGEEEDKLNLTRGSSVGGSWAKMVAPVWQKSPASAGNRTRTSSAWNSTQASPAADPIVRRRQHARSYGVVQPAGNVSLKEDEQQEMSKELRDAMRMSRVIRKKDFKHMETAKGRMINIVEGLELHTGVFDAEEQKKIVDCVYDFQEKGRAGKLRERTYSEPKKWMKGKGRATIQFGCCYNYAVDKDGNPPGIIRSEEVDPIPPLLKNMIKRMVQWRVLPPTCVPNSCIVNIYDRDDCIPPHIDHHDFVRPFCTVSFLAACNIVFGTELKIIAPGEFSGPVAIPLPLGSVLILNGSAADVAKHCVPAVPAKRISITFRKMDDSKLPYRFKPDHELQNLRPLPVPSSGNNAPTAQPHQKKAGDKEDRGPPTPTSASTCSAPAPMGRQMILHYLGQSPPGQGGSRAGSSQLCSDDFPPLSSSKPKPRRSLRQ